jgi:hypothetical protein
MARVAGSSAFSRPIAAEAFCGLLATPGDFIHSDYYHLWTSYEWGPQSQCGRMKKSRFGDWQLQKAFPPHLPPETDKQIGRQGDHCWRA